MSRDTVHLGFEVDSGEPVEIPIAHMVVTGMTQQAGKTTTLAGLIARSGLRAVTFVTKRGEQAFRDMNGAPMQPFFRERADWVFVASLIDATLGEKNKLLRAWLMKVCRDTRTLADVQRNVLEAKKAARGFSESIYTEIEGYLELVVPQLRLLPPAAGVHIGPGLNVMDLSQYSTELQALVIRSVLEHVFDHEHGVITVIPEAWEFLPEGRGSPVKREAESLIRKGAGLRNFVWLDSQDLAGVWKTAVRAAPVALIGVQREANEIKRTLANIPAGIAKPKASDIATLERGQFYACHGRHSIKTYVQPAWMPHDVARGVALGDVSLGAAQPRSSPTSNEESEMSAGVEKKLDTLIALLTPGAGAPASATPTTAAAPPAQNGHPLSNEDELYERFKARLAKEAPILIKLLSIRPEIEVTEAVQKIELDSTTLRGRLILLATKGFFDNVSTGNSAFNELKRTGFATSKPNVYRECDRLAELGLLTKETEGYQVVPDLKTRVVRRSA